MGGKLLAQQNKMVEAEQTFTEAYQIQTECGSTSAEALASLTRIADAQQIQGRQGCSDKLTEAEQNYNRAVDGLEKTVGWSDGNTNLAANNLYQLYLLLGRLDDAQALVERVAHGLEQ